MSSSHALFLLNVLFSYCFSSIIRTIHLIIRRFHLKEPLLLLARGVEDNMDLNMELNLGTWRICSIDLTHSIGNA